MLLSESGSFRPWVVSAWVVSAKFWGESIRPILEGRFGPWGGGGGYSTYVGLDPASTVYPIKHQEYQTFPNKCLKFCDTPKIPNLYLALRKSPKMYRNDPRN